MAKTQIVRSEEQQKPRGRTHPTDLYTTTRRNKIDESTSNKSHNTGRTSVTPQRPQHQKHNKHIPSARVWDTFSTQPGRLSTGHRPHGEKSQNRPPYGRNRPVGPATNHVSYIRTKPLLYYSITSKGGHTAKQEKNQHQYDAFARVY